MVPNSLGPVGQMSGVGLASEPDLDRTAMSSGLKGWNLVVVVLIAAIPAATPPTAKFLTLLG